MIKSIHILEPGTKRKYGFIWRRNDEGLWSMPSEPAIQSRSAAKNANFAAQYGSLPTDAAPPKPQTQY